MHKFLFIIGFLVSLVGISAANSLPHILYFENNFVEGSPFKDFTIYDSSNFNVELSKNFGGFDLNILGGELVYNSSLWGTSFSYTQSGQEDLELYGDEPTTDPLGYFGAYSKLFALDGYYRPINMLTVYAETKIRTYKVIDYGESEFYGSFYLGTESFNKPLSYRVFAGVWNYTPDHKSVGNFFGEASYLFGNFKPKFSTDLKYYSLSEEMEVKLRASVVGYKLIALYFESQVTGNNIFSTGLAFEYQRYGVSYDLHILKENVDPIHKISVKIPIF